MHVAACRHVSKNQHDATRRCVIAAMAREVQAENYPPLDITVRSGSVVLSWYLYCIKNNNNRMFRHFMTLVASKIRLVMELRKQNLKDSVLAALERTPREFFVPECFADQAYENTALPLPHGQTISQPGTVAHMVNALDIQPHHKVLEIGTGSGYQAAILAQLAKRVYTMDIHRTFIHQCQPIFNALEHHNITAMAGDGRKGWPMAAPFDRIILAAAAMEPPVALLNQLADGGKMLLPMGNGGNNTPQTLRLIHKDGLRYTEEDIGSARFVPLQQPQASWGTPFVIGDTPQLAYA
jgi:protein-L-isoaspartate(D-aspartate) O-methyltransferase